MSSYQIGELEGDLRIARHRIAELEATLPAIEGAAIALCYADGYYRDEYAKLIAGLKKAAELIRG